MIIETETDTMYCRTRLSRYIIQQNKMYFPRSLCTSIQTNTEKHKCKHKSLYEKKNEIRDTQAQESDINTEKCKRKHKSPFNNSTRFFPCLHSWIDHVYEVDIMKKKIGRDRAPFRSVTFPFILPESLETDAK